MKFYGLGKTWNGSTYGNRKKSQKPTENAFHDIYPAIRLKDTGLPLEVTKIYSTQEFLSRVLNAQEENHSFSLAGAVQVLGVVVPLLIVLRQDGSMSNFYSIYIILLAVFFFLDIKALWNVYCKQFTFYFLKKSVVF